MSLAGWDRSTNSPPKLGGVPSRSEGGAVCSKTRSDLINFREALRLLSVRCANLMRSALCANFEQTAPPLRGTPPNLGGDCKPHALISILPVLIVCAPLVFSAPDTFPRFVDVAAKVGITLMNICGGAAKDYIVEANGNGAAFFDYDNDGKMDVLIVNGSTLDNYKKGGDPMVALYEMGGHFVDVTAQAAF